MRTAEDHFPTYTEKPQRTPLIIFVPLDGHKEIALPDSLWGQQVFRGVVPHCLLLG